MQGVLAHDVAVPEAVSKWAVDIDAGSAERVPHVSPVMF